MGRVEKLAETVRPNSAKSNSYEIAYLRSDSDEYTKVNANISSVSATVASESQLSSRELELKSITDSLSIEKLNNEEKKQN